MTSQPAKPTNTEVEAKAGQASARASRNWVIPALFGLGLLLRLVGVLFSGMHDVDQIVLVWGISVREQGLGQAFAGTYGVLSYAAFGAAAEGAAQTPRFWWAPYKLLEIASELGILGCLTLLLRPDLRWWALCLFWLNPWFVVHGAWHGFWDGPHTLFGLIGLVVLRASDASSRGWMMCGVSFAIAALFKPQGLAYFVLPMGMFLMCLTIVGRMIRPLASYAVGVVAIILLGSAVLGVTGGDPNDQIASFVQAVNTMPALCNGCVGVWRPVTGALQALLGQEGPSYMLVLPINLDRSLNLIGLTAAYGVVACLALRFASITARRTGIQSETGALLVTLAALIVPQLAPHAHLNHTYAAAVLLIPFIVGKRQLVAFWSVIVAVMLYAHLATYQLGVVPDIHERDGLLQLQSEANALLVRHVPLEPAVTVLSIVVCAASVAIVWCLVRAAATYPTADRGALRANGSRVRTPA